MYRLSAIPALLLAVRLAAQTQTLTPFQQQKARALLRDQLPCLGCHELDGSGGRSAPLLTGVGARRGATHVRGMIVDPQAHVPGSAMPRVPMSPATRELVIAYLSRDDNGGSHPPIPVPTSAQSPELDGAMLYRKWCVACHGAQGRGDGPNAPYLPVRPAVHASAAEMSRRSDDVLFDAIAGGGAVMGKSPRMPPFGATLSAAQIRALVGYIRTLCSCRGPAWSTDDAHR